jgi:TATA-box binding protein (TBP) (component of TFIID and TFIIIB)
MSYSLNGNARARLIDYNRKGFTRRIMRPCELTVIYVVIQSVLGGKVNILGGHSIGHSKQTVYMYMCPIPNGFRDRAISLHIFKIVNKKQILRTVSNTGTYCSSDKVGTVYLI